MGFGLMREEAQDSGQGDGTERSALAKFFRKGHRGASLRMIMKEAGVKTGSFCRNRFTGAQTS